MNAGGGSLEGRAAELARAFDRSFAEPPRTESVELVDLLAIGVDRDPFALRLAELSGLFVDKKITPLPSDVVELLGVAGFRGVVVPVYDLRALLGYRVTEPPRWLVLASASVDQDTAVTALALAFDRFDGQLRVPIASIAADGVERSTHVREVLRTEGTESRARPIVHLPALFHAIANRARAHAPRKE